MSRAAFLRRALAIAAFCLALPIAAGAQEPVSTTPAPSTGAALTDREAERLDAESAELAAELRCPVCRNQSVLESNAELSREMQALVRERLAAGETPEQVKTYFVSRYGEWILLEPERRGINLVVWVLPFAALAVGGAVAIWLLRRWSRPVPAAAGATDEPGLSEENERWLREALREG
ncbi:MAG: cytochrome c-type biogenesis protein [Gemmatimonadota bacterium]